MGLNSELRCPGSRRPADRSDRGGHTRWARGLLGVVVAALFLAGAAGIANPAIVGDGTQDPWYESTAVKSSWSGACWYDQYRYCIRNCTSYTAQRLVAAGASPSDVMGLGNGGSWYAKAEREALRRGLCPEPGRPR